MISFPVEVCKPETRALLLSKARSAAPSDWWRENATVEWRIRTCPEDFAGNPVVEAVLQEFVNPQRMYIQRLGPQTSYMWHSDYVRDASLNMGLNAFGDSYTLYGEREDSHYKNLTPLRYQPDTLYCCNGAHPHCGINFTDEVRYLVSISVDRPARVEDVLAFVEGLIGPVR